MWLLSTERAELQWFNHPDDIPGGYAILSHTWGKAEQTFRDVFAIGRRCKRCFRNPRNSYSLSEKIRECCVLAERYGYAWVWIDSCCIDKDSSTELSEALNSMFKWYWQAEVCFAFLADVSTGTEEDLRKPGSEFRKSRWHQRGWTLQELIAPAVVIFMSKDWRRLGTKAELADLVEDITNIPKSILTRKQFYHETSIANRMWWASKRKTTRPEDQAYCLLGLFNVSMSIIYGEGTHAFIRLQQKLMKHGGFDMSLFAWGGRITSQPFVAQNLKPVLDNPFNSFNDSSYLLAPSPASFEAGFDFLPLLPVEDHPDKGQIYPPLVLSQEDKDHGAPFAGIKIPTATLQNYGVACQLPVFTSDGLVVAVLLCIDKEHQQIGLLLTQDEWGSYDPHRPLYHTSVAIGPNNDSESDFGTLDAYRLVTLGNDLYNLEFNGKRVVAHWRTLYIHPRQETVWSTATSIPRLRLNCTDCPNFRIPHWLIAHFIFLGFQPSEVTPWGDLPFRLTLINGLAGEYIYLDLGVCDRVRTHPRWARILIHHDQDLSNAHAPLDHNCDEDHIAAWPERTMLFGDSSARSVELSFQDCSLVVADPKTLAVNIKLKGPVYADILRQAEERRGLIAHQELASPILLWLGWLGHIISYVVGAASQWLPQYSVN